MSGITLEAVSDTFAALLKADPTKAESIFGQIGNILKATEGEAKRKAVVDGVSILLRNVQRELVDLIPAGYTLLVTHHAGKNDKGEEESRLSFEVKFPGGLTTPGSAAKSEGKARATGKLAKVTLDGADVVAPSWRSLLDSLNAALKAAGKAEIKVPSSSFNARALIMGAASKTPGLVYVGDVDAPAPAK